MRFTNSIIARNKRSRAAHLPCYHKLVANDARIPRFGVKVDQIEGYEIIRK